MLHLACGFCCCELLVVLLFILAGYLGGDVVRFCLVFKLLSHSNRDLTEL